MRSFVVAAAVLAFAASAAGRTFTVYNNCPFTVWPAIFTDLNVGSIVPDYTTGWEQASFQAVSFNVPDNWRSGRIWGRRDCDFSNGPPGPNSCLDGGCNGGLVCDPHTGTGVPPATLAEFTLGPNLGPDNYDVSVVDGYNLPMRIDNNKGCSIGDCPVDLGPNCKPRAAAAPALADAPTHPPQAPTPSRVPFDSSGFPVGCKSACAAGLGDPVNNPNCCTGTHSTPETCPSSGVQFYSYFKGNCPNAYAYAYDDPSSLHTCAAELQADYTVTFCP